MKVILGGGLAGLSAALKFRDLDERSLLIERGDAPGGLARTFEAEGFRFDLGGHRLLTEDARLDALFRELLGSDLLRVRRKSSILLGGRYFDYPLRPLNALSGFGAFRSARIIGEYLYEKVRQRFGKEEALSLRDWVRGNFGNTLYEIYFRDYSEKVWGISCDEISSEWVSKRIQGLSLGKAISSALFRKRHGSERTLTDSFYYPRSGIGELPERLLHAARSHTTFLGSTEVVEIHHSDGLIRGITLLTPEGIRRVTGEDYLSTISVTALLRALRPSPPEDLMERARTLRYRDLMVVVIMLDKDSVSDLTWLYIPERAVPFGRVHEPRNWSPEMAPDGKTHLVVEYFTNSGDDLWNMEDETISDITTGFLEALGIIGGEVVTGYRVLRIHHAYPVFDIHYRRTLQKIMDYLARFRNLSLAGRTGGFEYLNMDQAMLSGMNAAEEMGRRGFPELRCSTVLQPVAGQVSRET